MNEPNEFEIAGRATKMYHLIRVLEPVLEKAAAGGSIADLCARLDEEAWELAAKKAGVIKPSEKTQLAIIETFRQRERVAGLSPITGEQIAGPLTGEQWAAPEEASNGGTTADRPHPTEAHPAAHSPGVRREQPPPLAAGTSHPAQHSIFDSGAAAVATEDAIDRVDAHADPEWSNRALEAVRRVALRKSSFIVDEVWHELGEEPVEPRAMGPVMRRAAAKGLIARTERYQESERVTAHRNPRRIWQSLIVVREVV